MAAYDSVVVGHGTRLQSGIPKRPFDHTPEKVNGLLLRAVVIATYVIDDDHHPFAEHEDRQPEAVYCDVIAYGKEGPFSIRTVPVSYERSGMHSSRIWRPRAAKLDVTETTMDLDKSNPAALDGDHVLIGFIDDNFYQPIILRCLSHPGADIGNEENDVGFRTRLRLTDGDPDLFRHKGGFYGIDTHGNFLVDLTKAYVDDDFQSDGKEPPPAEDGAAGHHQVRLQKGSTMSVIIEEGATLLVTDKDGNATMTVGDGAVGVAIADALEDFWTNQVKPKFDAADNHQHVYNYISPSIPSATVPTIPAPGTPNPKVELPGYASAITSTKVKIPDG